MNEQNNEQTAAFSFSALFNKVSFSVDTTGFEYAKLGTPVEIRIRKKTFPGVVVKKRFYEKNYKK